MVKEKIVKIQGLDVAMIYCVATETGYERLAEKNIGNIDFLNEGDVLNLALSAIEAAYKKRREEPPVTSDTLLYEITPQELTDLITAVIELRAEWYKIPEVAKSESEETDKEKNA